MDYRDYFAYSHKKKNQLPIGQTLYDVVEPERLIEIVAELGEGPILNIESMNASIFNHLPIH